MRQALYGPAGFFTRPGPGPAGHFRTSVLASPLFATALARLVVRVDERLGSPARLDVVDVGAGRGELLRDLRRALPATVADRVAWTAVELAGRPADLPSDVNWLDRPPNGVVGVLLALEWLDNVPLDVAGVTEGGQVRYTLVGPDGTERPGPELDPADTAWLDRWWQLDADEPGTRAEIGLNRDRAWAGAVAAMDRGLALAVDYGHLAGSRPRYGTLTAFRAGREVSPRPDGSCDLTAHVAMDAVAAAGERVAGTPAALMSQRAALRALGLDGARPPLDLAYQDPARYLRALSTAGAAAELMDPAGLGGHHWLLQPVRTGPPLG